MLFMILTLEGEIMGSKQRRVNPGDNPSGLTRHDLFSLSFCLLSCFKVLQKLTEPNLRTQKISELMKSQVFIYFYSKSQLSHKKLPSVPSELYWDNISCNFIIPVSFFYTGFHSSSCRNEKLANSHGIFPTKSGSDLKSILTQYSENSNLFDLP